MNELTSLKCKNVSRICFPILMRDQGQDLNANTGNAANGPWLDDPHWANARQFPHHVIIESQSPSNNRTVFCGGALIGLQWVLTSASCAISGSNFILRIGSIVHHTGGDLRSTFDVYVHPSYSPANLSSDVALIRLPAPLSAQNHTIIPLPNAREQNVDLTNRIAIATGFGTDAVGNVFPVLRSSYVQILNRNDTQCTRLSGKQPANRATAPLLCASVFVRAVRQCFGDSGTPLIMFEANRWILLGLSVYSSADQKCLQTVNLYTNVNEMRKWIASVSNIQWN